MNEASGDTAQVRLSSVTKGSEWRARTRSVTRPVSGMTTELAGRVKTVYADGVEETRLVLDNNVEIAFGSADHIRDKERVALGIMEQHPDSVAYINVRDPASPTYRAL